MAENYDSAPEEKKLAPHDLFDFEESLSLDAFHDALVALDVHGNIRRLNAEGARLSGYSERELAGKPVAALFTCGDLNAENGAAWLGEHSQRKTAPGEPHPSFTARLKTAGGGLIPVDIKASRICGGKSDGYLVSAIPLAAVRPEPETREQETAAQRISAAEKKCARLFLFNPTGMVLIDGESGLITDANPPTKEIFNAPADTLRGKKLEETGLSLNCMDFAEFNRRIAAGDALSDIDGIVTVTEHHVKKVAVSAFSLGDGHPRATVVSFVDATENERMRNSLLKREKFESIWNTTGGCIHDFNNVLGIILGYAGILKINMKDNPGKETVEQIELACLRGRELSQKLMAFLNGKPPEIQRCDALQIVRKTVKLLFANKETIATTVSAPESLWDIRADESQITQVMENLLSNAAEALRGKGKIEITLSNVDAHTPEGKAETSGVPAQQAAFDGKTRAYVKISVRDHGPGIPQKNLERLFNPFFTTKPGGHGLGLPSVAAIMKSHRGAVVGQNAQDGNGAVFSVFIPAVSTTGSLLQAAKNTHSC